MKKLKNLLILVAAIAVVSGNAAFAEKIGYVDSQKVVMGYSKTTKMNDQLKIKDQELKDFIESAKAKVSKETDETKKKDLDKKLTEEYNQKKSEALDFRQKQLQEIDKDISKAVNDVAKEQKYDYIFDRKILYFGGTDISDAVLKKLSK